MHCLQEGIFSRATHLLIHLFVCFKYSAKENDAHYEEGMAAKMIRWMYRTGLPAVLAYLSLTENMLSWILSVSFADNSALIHVLRSDCLWLPKTKMNDQDFNLLLITLSKALGRTKCQAQNGYLWSYFISEDIHAFLTTQCKIPFCTYQRHSCKRSGLPNVSLPMCGEFPNNYWDISNPILLTTPRHVCRVKRKTYQC